MTIPTNQYEADEKFDVEQDKLEERIQRKINIISKDSNRSIDALLNYSLSEDYKMVNDRNELLDLAYRWQAEQDIKNDED